MDADGNSIVVRDHLYFNEPNGRILLFSSQFILDWLGTRQEEDLCTVSRVCIDATFKVSLKYYTFSSYEIENISNNV